MKSFSIYSLKFPHYSYCEWQYLFKMFAMALDLFCVLPQVTKQSFSFCQLLHQEFSQIVQLLYKADLYFHGILEWFIIFPFSRFALIINLSFAQIPD